MEAVCKPRMCIDFGFCGKYEGRDIKWGVRKSRKKKHLHWNLHPLGRAGGLTGDGKRVFF